jgi:sulfur-oxidizing protein SoxY
MDINLTRRAFLKGALTTGAVATLTATGLLIPRSVMAAWPKEAFAAAGVSEALELLLGSSRTRKNKDIGIRITPHADSAGSEISVEVKTGIPGVESISVLVADSPTPLAASFRLGPDSESHISTRLKIAKSGDIIVVIKTQQHLYSASKKVNLVGCGCE